MKKNTIPARFVIAASVLFLSLPMTLNGADKTHGHDWYCPDAEAHKQIIKHMKEYHQKDSATIAEKIAEIYKDASLSDEEKQKKTMSVIDSYLNHLSLGTGD